jgi:hypothetical protein
MEPKADLETRYYELLQPLFVSEGDTDWLELAYSILRVSGMSLGHWDASVESRELLADLDALLLKMELPSPPLADPELTRWRLGLLAYLHVIEMSAPYHLIANLLRVQNGQRYVIDPFHASVGNPKKKAKKNTPPPPTPTDKIAIIRSLAGARFAGVAAAFDDFYFAPIRNAIAHSDYTIDGESFRLVGGQVRFPGEQFSTSRVPLDRLGEIINTAFAFHRVFFNLEKEARKDFASYSTQRFRYGDGDVEFLANDEGLMYGFRIHWPSGAFSEYFENREGRVPRNIRFVDSGSVGFIEGAILAYCQRCRTQLRTVYETTTEKSDHDQFLDAPCPTCGATPRELGAT